jgi:hypothetical protein
MVVSNDGPRNLPLFYIRKRSEEKRYSYKVEIGIESRDIKR